MYASIIIPFISNVTHGDFLLKIFSRHPVVAFTSLRAVSFFTISPKVLVLLRVSNNAVMYGSREYVRPVFI